MSDEDLDLGEDESDEEPSFPPAERKVVTQPYDLSIQTLLEQWESELLILPEIQRQYVWDNGRASRLIESLLLNIPVPILYFAETKDAKYEIIDGHQRVRSIVRFLHNELPLSGLKVLTEYRGKRFRQLPEREQRFLRMRTLRAVIISHESHPSMKFEIFERLNSGSITLNAQELRNSLYRGDFNKLLHELAKDRVLREIVGTKQPRNRMVDEELILRFFALRDGLDVYKTPLKRFLNDYMETVRDPEEAMVVTLRTLFEATVRRVRSFIGAHAFRITDAHGDPLERAVNRALFDSQMLAFSWVDGDKGADRQSVRSEVSSLYQSEGFLDAIRRATGDRARTRRRVGDMVRAIQRAGLPVHPPFDLTD